MHRVDAAIGQKAGHEKTGEPARRLRKHEECIRHGRGKEPFVASDCVLCARPTSANRLRLGGVGANIRTTLLFGHAHAERNGILVVCGHEARIVAPRHNLGDPLLGDLGLQQQNWHGCIRHGDGAAMTSLHLGGHIEGASTGYVGIGRR